jgi:hypothetical protein
VFMIENEESDQRMHNSTKHLKPFPLDNGRLYSFVFIKTFLMNK